MHENALLYANQAPELDGNHVKYHYIGSKHRWSICFSFKKV